MTSSSTRESTHYVLEAESFIARDLYLFELVDRKNALKIGKHVKNVSQRKDVEL